MCAWKLTTRVGRFKIGWRKRVIHIDWKDSKVDLTAEQLFPEEDTTKDGRMIHAWSYKKAGEYVARVLATAPATVPAETPA